MCRTRSILAWILVGGPVAAHSQGVTEPARDRVQRAGEVVRHDSVAVFEASWRRAMRSGPNGPGARIAALGVATLARRTYRWREADAIYASLVPRDPTSADAIAVQAMLGHAVGLLTRWRLAEAMPLLEQARIAANRLGDALTQGEVLTAMSSPAGRSGGADSARTLLRRAAALLPPRSVQAAQRLCIEAGVERGQSIKMADSLVTEGLSLARALGDSLVIGRCLVALGTVFEAKGLIRRADEPMTEAVALFRTAREYEALGSAQQWLAYTLITYTQEFGAGRRWAEQAIANGERTGSPLIVAWARLNLAQATLRVGDAVSGLRAAREAEVTFRRIGDPAGELAARSIGADALMLSGNVATAVREYVELQVLLRRMGTTNAVPPNQLRQAAGLIELGQLDAAEQAIDSAVALATARGIRGIVTSSQHYWRGLIALRRGAHDRAIERFLQFKRGVGASPAHLNLDADVRIAEAYALSGRFAQAESVFTRGSASLDAMRARTGARDDVLRLLSGLRYDTDTDLGIATIVSAFVAAGRVDGAFSIAESERARWLWIQRTRRGAMARTPAPERPLEERMLELADVRQALDGRSAVLAYLTGRGGEPTTLFAIWRDGVRAFVLAPADSLTRDLQRFTATLEGGAMAGALARSLGARLLDSAIRVLPADIRHLRVVPDGPLHHLPFDALVLADGRRVLERFVTSRAPSARLAVTPARSPVAERVVAYGDPVFDSRFGLPRLPGSADEAQAVVRAVGGRGETRLRLGARASTLREGSLQNVSVLHLATHARVEDWGMIDNAIYLGAGPGDNGRVGAEDLATMPLGVGLVVLSGCRTVGGLVANGEGVQGLVSPILEAGAGAVVVTHWNIRDRSLLALMTSFYRAMASGGSADESLSRAKRESLARGDSPAVWAAVTLVGDGSVRPFQAGASGSTAPARPSGPSFHRRDGR